MFTVHLERIAYLAAITAAKTCGNPREIPLGFESEPAVEVGEEIEIVVPGETNQFARVLRKVKPYAKMSPAEQAAVEATEAINKRQAASGLGIDLSKLPADAYGDTLRDTQWYLLVVKSRP